MSVSSETNARRRLFCCWYVTLGSAEEAAVRAGFPRENALAEGLACLRSEQCVRTIAQLRAALTDSGNVIAGLKRLAFGSCTDAVRLAFAEELPPPSVIDSLDLYCVSEIKRDKGGGVEVRLFDRMKALEKLYELENAFSDKDKAESLINALASSAGEAE